MTIKSIDKATAKLLAAKIQEALQDLAEEHGVSIKRGNGTFSPDGNNFTLKLEINMLDESGEVITKEMTDFKDLAHQYGLKPEDLGREFIHNNMTYKVIGLKSRAYKTPILCQRVGTEKIFKFPENSVAKLLEDCAAA